MRKPIQVILICLLLVIAAILAGMIGFRFSQWKVEDRELPGNIEPGKTDSNPDKIDGF